MILYADGGSTKCDWALVGAENKVLHRFATVGLNPYTVSGDEISRVLRSEVFPIVRKYSMPNELQVRFYGAGVAFEGATVMQELLSESFPLADVVVGSDIEGAVRATVGDSSGVVCILGTGSASCYCENGQIVKRVASLGYVLGDEGSGAVLGRTLVGDVFKGVAPRHIIEVFNAEYHLSQADILDNVYRKPSANRFFASFAPFLSARLDDEYIYELVANSFTQFVRRNVLQYPSAQPVWFVGSVAYYFRAVLEDVLRRERLQLGGIIRRPLDCLESSKKSGERVVNQQTTFVKLSEQPSYYDNLERASVHELIYSINKEDRSVAEAVGRTLPQVEKLVEQLVPRLRRGGRLFYIGAGTSGRLGVLDASEVPPTFGMPPTVVIGVIAGGDRALRNPVEGAEDNTEQGWKDLLAYNPTADDTVVGIAASGTTPYVIGAIRSARENGLLTACITSNPCSPLAKEADIAIETIVGPEFVTGSSRMKSGTAQKMVCNMITTSAMIGIGRVKGNRMVNMQLSNRKLVDRGTRMIVEMLNLPYEQAERLLMMHGSVQKVLDAVFDKNK